MAFDLLALSLLMVLLMRLGKAAGFRERIFFYLFFFLYLGLFSYHLLDPDVPDWFRYFNAALFLGGGGWFLAEPLFEMFQRHRAARAALKGLKKEKGGLYEVVAACHLLSQAKLGALIAVQRRQSLERWCEKGVCLDAAVSRELIFAVFTPPGALHDGALILRGNRLAAAAVIVPLTQMPQFPKELGTRHRAAVGFSEATDALCLVVSEESGTISLADRGILYYDIPFEKLPALLERALRFQLRKNKSPLQTLVPASA